MVLESRGICTIHVVKTKALITFAVTAKPICAFVFAYAKCWFSHYAIMMEPMIESVQYMLWDTQSTAICKHQENMSMKIVNPLNPTFI